MLFSFPFPLFLLSLSPSVFFSFALSCPFLSFLFSFSVSLPFHFSFSLSFLNLSLFLSPSPPVFLFFSSLFLLIPSISLHIFPTFYFPFCFPIPSDSSPFISFLQIRVPFPFSYFLPYLPFPFPSPLLCVFLPLSHPFHFSNYHHFLISCGTFKAFHDTIGILWKYYIHKADLFTASKVLSPHLFLYHFIPLALSPLSSGFPMSFTAP